MDLNGLRILVVGANGVLGSHIATLLTEAGARVLGTARNAASSTTLPSELDERLLVDLADPASIGVLADYLLTAKLDGIVNAAGVVGFGSAAETSAAQAAELMQINHAGPADLITRLLPALRASGAAERTPFVVGITGVVAERAFPGMAAYVASKSAHSAWLSALRLEVRRDRIRVIDAHPGHTETGLAGRARFGSAPNFPKGLDPERVARTIVDGIRGDATVLASANFA